MTEIEFEFTPEQQQAFRESFERAVEAARDFCNAIAEVVQKAIEIIKEIAISLARFFLKLQLLEWKIPYPLADLISRNLYWYWAMRLGFNWLERKFSLIE